MELSITSGTLSITEKRIHCGFESLENLIGFASRQNEKRGFLFVSKVLGKHIPVKPSVMRDTYDRMASLIGPEGDKALVIGMAETATGLGGGVADSYARNNPEIDVVYQHTTRHFLNAPELLRISESHSHAVSHILYEPHDALSAHYRESRHLVVIDDEISTGNTLLNLIQQSLVNIAPFNVVTVAALVSWLDKAKQRRFLEAMSAFCDEKGITTPEFRFVSLFEGSFEFTPDPDFQAKLPEDVDKEICKKPSLDSAGRRGCRMPLTLDTEHSERLEAMIAKIDGGQQVSVIGTGEHLTLPFLMAEAIENSGYDVVFQSTTRSPVLVDGSTIENAVEIPIQRDGRTFRHYIYNHSEKRVNFVVTESHANASEYSHVGVSV